MVYFGPQYIVVCLGPQYVVFCFGARCVAVFWGPTYCLGPQFIVVCFGPQYIVVYLGAQYIVVFWMPNILWSILGPNILWSSTGPNILWSILVPPTIGNFHLGRAKPGLSLRVWSHKGAGYAAVDAREPRRQHSRALPSCAMHILGSMLSLPGADLSSPSFCKSVS